MSIRRNCEWRIYKGSKAVYQLTDPNGITDGLVKYMKRLGYTLEGEIGDGATQAVFSGEGTSLPDVRFSNSQLKRLKRKYPGSTIDEQSTENVSPEISEKITKKRDVVPMSDGVMLHGKRPWFWQRGKYTGKNKQEISNFYNTRFILTQASDSNVVEKILGPLKDQLGYEPPEYDSETKSITATGWVPLTKNYMNKERIRKLRENGVGVQRQSNVMTRYWSPKGPAKKILRGMKQVV